MKFIKSLIENLKNPKKKSITLLVIYAIFFTVVFILINVGDSNNYNDVEKNNLDYEYIYKVYNNETIIEISGIYENNVDTFKYYGNNYVKKEGVVYLNGIPTQINFNIDDYKYEKIQLLIQNSESETTYKDSNKILYNINLTNYFELLNQENNCNIIDCNFILIPITVEKDKYINNVVIDLSSYYGYTYKIEITYNFL